MDSPISDGATRGPGVPRAPPPPRRNAHPRVKHRLFQRRAGPGPAPNRNIDHAHFIVEAAGAKPGERHEEPGGALRALRERRRLCRRLVFSRSGKVLADRFHHVLKRTPTEVRRALAYVLLNARKHFRQHRRRIPPVVLDGASSGVARSCPVARHFVGGVAPPQVVEDLLVLGPIVDSSDAIERRCNQAVVLAELVHRLHADSAFRHRAH